MSLTKFADSNLKTRFVKEVLQKSYVPILNTKENLGSTYKTIDKYSEPHETFDESWVGKNVIVEDKTTGIRKYGEVISYESSIDGSFKAIIETNEIDEHSKFIKIEITDKNIKNYSFHKPESPYIYQQVEWIESHRESQNSGAYIDTGIIANQDFGFDIKFVKLDEIGVNYGCIFGARQTSETQEMQLTTFRSIDNNGTIAFGNRWNADMINDTKSIQIATLKNKIYTSPYNRSHTFSIDFTTPVSVTLFGLNDNDTEEVIQFGDVKLYYFKMYKGDTLVRNFIPCYDVVSNVIGLLDLVQNKFYSNQSANGYFTKGPDVPNI